MATKEKIILPPKYYLDYFQFLVSFVKKHYESILHEPESGFIQEFQNLSEDAQCLFLRFSNRRGSYFRTSRIAYEEISNISKGIEELLEKSFISLDFEPDPRVIQLFTKSEILLICYQDHKKLKPLSKDELIYQCFEESAYYQELNQSEQIIEVLRQDEYEYLKMLFFGRYRAQMTEFVIRDVGNIKLETLDEEKFTPWFKSREEAMALFIISRLRSEISKGFELSTATDLITLIVDVPWGEFLSYPGSRKVTEKLLIKFAQQLERENSFDEALQLYQYTDKYPSRERRIRILDQMKETEGALVLAEKVLEDPVNASELIFAKDFLNRPKIRINRSTSERIKQALEITIIKQPDQKVEDASLEYFEKIGYSGWHSENYLWRSLFGLFFWEELFDQEHDTFHHPLQRVAADIFDQEFYSRRRKELEGKIKLHKNAQKFLNKLILTHQEKEGIANPFVHWFDDLPLILEKLLQYVNPGALGSVMLKMAQNLKDNSAGFPDLFIWKDDEYHFYEIKSPNDHLSSQQLFWLDFFKNINIQAEIVRVQYS